MNGKIVKGIGGFYYVKTAKEEIYECRARGVFRKENVKPYIGDIVEISVENGKGSVEKILPRKNCLIRPPVANIDLLVIVAAVASPEPNMMLIDKLLINSEINGIKPIICINKTDVKSDEAIRKVYQNSGYPILSVCASEEKGLDELIPYIQGKTSALAGLSGVGKSTILNLLTDTIQETGSVSDKIQRGRHTTRHVELLDLKCGGYVLDTPGFSSFEVCDIKASDLYRYFPEMAEVGDNCRFKGCSHINEPDCAVKELVTKGLLHQSRYNSYIEIYNQLKLIKEWEK
ncbi:MAG: ribosome small subunit-dependent GTPase A [Ruminococcaceae bacterium]|nr:ribosome small subunit-dependent GTPase A [Oscillospiraceae bacterium]